MFNESDQSIIDTDNSQILNEYSDLPLPKIQSDLSNISNFLKNLEENQINKSPQKEVQKTQAKTTVQRPEIAEDFIWNFLVQNQLQKTFSAFQEELYQRRIDSKDQLKEAIEYPDLLTQQLKTNEQLKHCQEELDKIKIENEQNKAMCEKHKKQAQYFKTLFIQQQQDNNLLKKLTEKHKIKDLQNEQKFQELAFWYENQMKEKTLLKLEKEKLIAKLQIYQQKNADDFDKENKKNYSEKTVLKETHKENQLKTKIPKDLENPYENLQERSLENQANVFIQPKESLAYQAHQKAVLKCKINPQRNLIATISDEKNWKILKYSQKENEIKITQVYEGKGQEEWFSDIALNPQINTVALSFGNGLIKLYDFDSNKTLWNIKDYSQTVWSLDFNHSGEFLLAVGLDNNIRLYDLHYQKSWYSFKGHVDSVNKVLFSWYSSKFFSASSDKTISQWDSRSTLPDFTLFGHTSPILNISLNKEENLIISCDTWGGLKQWDLRTRRLLNEIQCGKESLTGVAYDYNGDYCYAADSKGVLYTINLKENKIESKIQGHKDSINDTQYDFENKILFTCSQDCLLKLWK